MKALIVSLLLLVAHGATLAGASRVFVLADTHGQRQQYVTFEQLRWPDAGAERRTFAMIGTALDRDSALGVMMIAPDAAAEERAARALRSHLQTRKRRLAIRHRVGPLEPGILYGRADR